MKPIQFHEILDVEEYATQREKIRPAMIARRTRRRLHLGEHMTLHFENRDTVFYQIQEMVRAEHITAPEAIVHEMETYNELVPGTDELSATLMVEYPTAQERVVELPKLLGLEGKISLVVGSAPPCVAEFDKRQLEAERLSSVQFLRFRVDPEPVALMLRDPPPPVLIRCTHPHDPAEAFVPGSLLEELRRDLRG
jgi:Protein of unknown function (DUF3501)